MSEKNKLQTVPARDFYEEREQYLEKPLPSSAESERVVLGAVLLDNRLIIEAMSFLTADDFYSPLHRKIFAAMVTLAKTPDPANPQQTKKIDPILIGEVLKKTESLDSLGGVATITNLSHGLPHFSGIADYCQVVKDKSEIRAMIKWANALTSEALEETSTAAELKASYMPRMTLIGEARLSKPKSSAQIWENVKSRFNSWMDDTKIHAVGSGIPELNAALRFGGFAPQDLIFVAARPSIGKTALMLTFTSQAAMLGLPPLDFTLEMSEEDLFMRMLPARSGVKNMAINPTTIRKNSEARIRLKTAGDELAKLTFFLEGNAFDLDKLIAKAEIAVRRDGVKIVLLDYLQMIKATTGNGEGFGLRRRRDQELEEISRELKRFAKRANVPVVCLAQLNRAVEIDDRRPEISDIREAGASEQDADVIILPYRPDSRRKKKDAKGGRGALVTPDFNDDAENDSIVKVNLFIGKQRNGRANFDVETEFDMDYQRFMTTKLWAEDNLDKLE